MRTDILCLFVSGFGPSALGQFQSISSTSTVVNAITNTLLSNRLLTTRVEYKFMIYNLMDKISSVSTLLLSVLKLFTKF